MFHWLHLDQLLDRLLLHLDSLLLHLPLYVPWLPLHRGDAVVVVRGGEGGRVVPTGETWVGAVSGARALRPLRSILKLHYRVQADLQILGTKELWSCPLEIEELGLDE